MRHPSHAALIVALLSFAPLSLAHAPDKGRQPRASKTTEATPTDTGEASSTDAKTSDTKTTGEEATQARSSASPETASSDLLCPYQRVRPSYLRGSRLTTNRIATTEALEGVGDICDRCAVMGGERTRSLFSSSTSDTLALCSEEMTAQLLHLTRFDDLSVVLDGHVMKGEDGESILCVRSLSVGSL